MLIREVFVTSYMYFYLLYSYPCCQCLIVSYTPMFPAKLSCHTSFSYPGSCMTLGRRWPYICNPLSCVRMFTSVKIAKLFLINKCNDRILMAITVILCHIYSVCGRRLSLHLTRLSGNSKAVTSWVVLPACA